MGNLVKSFCLVILLALLGGCATTTNVADGTRMKPDYGLLVFKATTRFPWAQLQYRKFSTNSSFGYFFAEEFTGPEGAFLNNTGDTYWVKPVKAGEYMWSKIVVGQRYAIFHGSNRFTIKPNTVTYVGHLTIEEINGSARIGVVDDEADMRAYLGANFPKYLETMSIEKSVTDFSL